MTVNADGVLIGAGQTAGEQPAGILEVTWGTNGVAPPAIVASNYAGYGSALAKFSAKKPGRA